MKHTNPLGKYRWDTNYKASEDRGAQVQGGWGSTEPKTHKHNLPWQVLHSNWHIPTVALCTIFKMKIELRLTLGAVCCWLVLRGYYAVPTSLQTLAFLPSTQQESPITRHLLTWVSWPVDCTKQIFVCIISQSAALVHKSELKYRP